MKTSKTPAYATLLAVVLMISVLSGAQAEEKITVQNGQVTIENKNSGKVLVLDTMELERMISTTMNETMEGMGDMLAEMEDMQLEIRLGQDNQLSVETEDQMFEMNLDLIFKEIGTALETAFDDVHTEQWTVHRHRHDEEFDQEELEEELEQLKEELQRLQEKLEEAKEL